MKYKSKYNILVKAMQKIAETPGKLNKYDAKGFVRIAQTSLREILID